MKKLFTILFALPITLVMAQNQSNIKKDPLTKFTAPSFEQKMRSSAAPSSVDCSNPNYIYCENFEDVTSPNLPDSMTTSSLDDNYFVPIDGSLVSVLGFYTGNFEDANAQGYWPVGDNTQFVMANDDACRPNQAVPNEDNNCDFSFVVLELPMIDMSTSENMYLTFDFHNDGNYTGGNAEASVEYKVGSGEWTDLAGNLPKSGDWQEGIFNLSMLDNTDSVYFRFIWTDANYWATGLAIDNITVRQLNDNEISIQSVNQFLPGFSYISTYSKVPQSQLGPGFFFQGIIRNVGNNAQDSVRLRVNSGTFNTQSWGINLPSLERDTFTTNDFFLPTATGMYDFSFSAESDSATATIDGLSVEVTENIFARDSDVADLRFSLVPTTSGFTIEHGCSFDIVENASLSAVDVYIAPSSDTGGKIKAKVYECNSQSETTQFYFESGFFDIQSTGSWQTLGFDQLVPLQADKEYLVTVCGDGNIISDTTRIGVSSSIDGSYAWRLYNGLPDAPEDGVYFSIPMVRMNFDPNAVGIADNEKVNFSVYPNPNNGQFLIEVSSDVVRRATLSIKDVLGKTVQSESINVVNTFSKNIDLRHLNKGVYFIHLSDTNSDNEEIQKVIIH